MDFKKRSDEFQDNIELLQKKYGIQLYAAQVILQNGELITIIKMRDMLPQVETKPYDHQAKAGNSADKKV